MDIKEQLVDGAGALEERVRPEIEAAKEKLADLNEKAISFVKAHPVQCIVGALAVGFLVGKIARGVRHET